MSATESLVKFFAEAGVTSVPGIGSAIEFVAAFADPGRRAAIEDATTSWVLEEIPRIHRLIAERVAEIEAARCTPEEVMALASQTLEAQRRAFFASKRRALTNVLVNGLCAKDRESARHRLFLRLTAELEPEHIAILESFVGGVSLSAPPVVRQGTDLRNTQTGYALIRELIARGLVYEETKSELDAAGAARRGRPQSAAEIKTKTVERPTILAYAFLEHLRDPEAPRPTPRRRPLLHRTRVSARG